MKIGRLGNRDIWKYKKNVKMEIWKLGNMAIWKYRNMEVNVKMC